MHFSLTKQWGKLDFRVWLCLILLSVCSLALFGYNMATKVKCAPVEFTVLGKLNHANEDSNTFFVNELVTFRAKVSAQNSKITWEYGDKSEKESGQAVSHIYAKEGNYLVTVTIDGQCSESLNIRIIEGGTSSLGSNAPSLNPIVSNDIVSVGEETIFNTSSVANSYSWSVEEMPEAGKINTQTARFIFNKPGNFTVALILDDGTTHKKIIQVNDPLAQLGQTTPLPPSTPMDIPPAPITPLPLPEKEEAKKEEVKPEAVKEETLPAKPTKTYDQLPTPAIKAMLEDVTEGKKSAADFNNILCNGAGTKVMANNESTTFAALINELQEKKGLPLIKRKRKIQTVNVVRDQANGNCVSILYVDFK